ncbi:putative mitochondrial chaperone bcs1 protein [Phaeoacremonium minimum UCRPA7]|uniref:Putative mitochondrial chaperone bcs1 protein n=1 Tax=Phaeoacremonium minimum (strain UCR-PA7) TaxID=1286976 RepID=R8BT29_PHAM7|nr:putative mitochondrial chaperone bcs1 protein [Phaeoacremonium minimum UCRPA7]EOO02425.1 putative mitochondrial chaperone bcs1 protein [Phaeoacremonium minimum UCRPA7]
MMSQKSIRLPKKLSAARQALANVAKETKAVLPGILQDIPHIHADESEVWSVDALPALDVSNRPNYPQNAAVKVINEDTFNAALDLAALHKAPNPTDRGARVAVLNFASDIHPGGGWLNGAVAQEEALCYRSSLSLSLHKRYYPIAARQGLYTPDVVVIRSAMSNHHALLTPETKPADLPVVSVVSIAAIRNPPYKKVSITKGDSTPTTKVVFVKPGDRELTKDKMRLTLRISAYKGHSLLVLGALGCGAFHGPVEDIADCWAEVLKEDEFAGGWWKEVWFAVYDKHDEGNFEIFKNRIGGLLV